MRNPQDKSTCHTGTAVVASAVAGAVEAVVDDDRQAQHGIFRQMAIFLV